MPSPYQTALDNSGAIINNSCVWVYLSGTTTAVDTFTSKTLGTANSNPIRSGSDGRFVAFLTQGVSYKFTFESSCTPPAHGTVLKTVDAIDAVPTAAGNVDVTGTAGATLAAGNVVYLSDGSGGLTAGLWYVATNVNAYSSTTPEIGLVPTAIASAASGTIRIVGSVGSLSGLTAGAVHYVGTAGALTATRPVNARPVGQADSTTSLILAANPATAPVVPQSMCGRLTLTTAVPVTVADVTAATTLYFAPYGCNAITLFDGTNWAVRTLTELSIAVPATTAQMYDVWVYDNAGVAALELLAWTSDTARATALTTQNGVLVKTGATTRRYVGSFRTTGVSGQTEDSFAKRYIWNYYNRVDTALRRLETTASWAYSTSTWRQANGATANQVEIVNGWLEDSIALFVRGVVSNSATVVSALVGIGENSTTALATGQTIGDSTAAASSRSQPIASLKTVPAVGYTKYVWLEYDNSGSGTTTWLGASSLILQSGIEAEWHR